MRQVFAFNLQATDFCKGVAVLLLLWHHLFLMHDEYGHFVQ